MVRLFAALVPPPTILSALATAAAARPVTAAVDDSWWRRRRGARTQAGLATDPAHLGAGPFVVEEGNLMIVRLGNVVPADGRRIAAALTQKCREIAPLVLRLGEVVALEPIGHDGIGLKVEAAGGEGALLELHRAVVSAAEEVGVFCDRRAFRPVLEVVGVTERTTEAQAQAVIDALAACPSMTWHVDAISLRRQVDTGPGGSVGIEEVPLAGSTAST